MIAAMINTTPMMLKTWLPVADTFITALNVEFANADVAFPPPPGLGAVVGMFDIVMKKAKTPTASMIRAITALMIWSGSMNLNFISFKLLLILILGH